MISYLEKLINWMLILFMAIISIIIFGQVIFRYIFSISFPWIIETSQIIFLYIVFFGAMIAARKEEHIEINAIKFITDKLSSKINLFLDISKYILIMITMILTALGAYELIPTAGRQNLSATNIPRSIMVYPVLMGSIIIIIFSLANIYDKIKSLNKRG
ncbi:MAG: TRAP transporter small permease [bacterium]